MSKKVKVVATSDSGYKITLNQQNQDLQELFAQFKQDFNDLPNILDNENKNFLLPISIKEIQPTRTKSQDKKRMKLIDYIYLKNTAKKNKHNSKVDKAGLSQKQLKKSRMKEGKQKAFKSIADEIISELKEISGQALAMADFANQSLSHTGNTDDIAKLCNIRRIIKDNILTNMGEIKKLMGVQSEALSSKKIKKAESQQEDELDNKLKGLEAIGVSRLESQYKRLSPKASNRLTVKHKHSNKDTWISERLDEREDP